MAKKKVAVSLRKPSRARDVDAQPAEAPAGTVDQVLAMSDAVPTAGVAQAAVAQDAALQNVALKSPVVGSVPADSALSGGALPGAALPGMALPGTALPGAPGAPVQPASIEEFVSGVAAALEQSASELRPSEVKQLLRRGPAGYRELTVLLPERLVLELEQHCHKYNLDLSPLVATALEFHLHQAQATAKKSRRRDRVAAAARALLTELTQRARRLWDARRASLRVGGAAEPSAS